MASSALMTSTLVALATLAGAAQAQTTVFAAASLRGVLDEIATLSRDPVVLSYAGSGTIARQVAQGAPADVVVLAHSVWMDWLEQRGAVDAGKTVIIAGNTLVVIGAPDHPPLTTPKDLPHTLGDGHLAIGQRDSVPAGIFAKEWLENIGIFQEVHEKLAETDNVRAALALVARQETPLGITYATDALAEPRVRVLYAIPETQHSAITYPATSLSLQGDAFVTLLQSDAAQAVFAAHGFRAP
jgi:molybdate transport system substrate-binding protein